MNHFYDAFVIIVVSEEISLSLYWKEHQGNSMKHVFYWRIISIFK